MRKLDPNGLDLPTTYYNAWTCVSDGETVKLPVLDGAVLPADMDPLKASAYWYDTRHDGSDGSGNTGRVADVDLAVAQVGTNVELSWFDVAGHTDPTCGSNAIQVFISYFAADSDPEAPSFDITTGAGVYPEHL